MQRLIAQRSFEYAGARVEAGQQFFARDGHVPFLTKTQRARHYEPQAAAPVYERRDMQAGPPAHIAVSAIDDLRARYETMFGRKPSGRWKEARLRAELEKII